MGAAKRRGTFEQRKAEAIARQKDEPVINNTTSRRVKTSTLMAMAAALAAGSSLPCVIKRKRKK